MIIDVIIPSVSRPDDAKAAIESVQAARRASVPGNLEVNIIVVHRVEDSATRDAAIASGATPVGVSRPGLAWAMRAGAEYSRADVVAFMDDDARMRAGWFERVEGHYSDAAIGGVGGADIQPHGYPVNIAQSNIGRIDRFGRVLGGHHEASGAARRVDHLKGANCSFRRADFLHVPFQDLIAGRGAQARNEFVASLAVAAQGRILVLDPAAAVDHYPAQRPESDARGSTNKAYETAYNESLGFALSRRPERFANGLFIRVIGYRNTPGLIRLLLRQASLRQVYVVFVGARDGRRAGLALRKGMLRR